MSQLSLKVIKLFSFELYIFLIKAFHELYMDKASLPLKASFEEIAKFWQKEFPKMANVALACLSAPPTQCSVERLFSFIAFIVNHLRTNLKWEKLNKICFIKSNHELAFLP